MARTAVPKDLKRHALVARTRVDKSQIGYSCPNCHIGWLKKADVPSECPLCSTVFDGFDSEGEVLNIYTRKKVEEIRKQKKEEEKLIKAIEREEEKKYKAKLKAKEKKAKEKDKAKKAKEKKNAS